MKALTAAEMREVDRLTTERHGVSGIELMENAGRKAADAVWRVIAGRENARVCVLCGKGNNGGDGFVVARHLQAAKIPTKTVLFGSPDEVRGAAAVPLKEWQDSGGKTEIVRTELDWKQILSDLRSHQVIVDAMLGTGLRGPASGTIARAISDLNRISGKATNTWPAFILAVDTPSGLPSDGEPISGPVLSAHQTVTFTAPKIGQLISPAANACGAIELAAIGSPEDLIEEVGKGNLRWSGPDEFVSLPLLRAADSHKGTFGHVLIVGGSVGKTGAAVMAGYSSLRSGAGLTTVACPDVTLSIVAAAHPEYMTEPLPSTAEGTIRDLTGYPGHIHKILEGKTVAAIGPGLGTSSETQQAIRHLVREATVPIILDADGLNAFAGNLGQLRERKTEFLAITPHPGEMARLLGVSNAEVQADRLKVASEAAKRANAHVLLKGFHTVLAAPDGRVWVNTTGSPALAKGGSGDVLTGVLAASTAQYGTKDWLRVLAMGVYLHGSAADIMSREKPEAAVLATEVATAIPDALEYLLRRVQFSA